MAEVNICSVGKEKFNRKVRTDMETGRDTSAHTRMDSAWNDKCQTTLLHGSACPILASASRVTGVAADAFLAGCQAVLGRRGAGGKTRVGGSSKKTCDRTIKTQTAGYKQNN